MIREALSDPWTLAAGMLLAGTMPCLWAAARSSALEALAAVSFAASLASLSWLAYEAAAGGPPDLVDGIAEILLLSGVGLLLLGASGLLLVDDWTSKLRSVSAATPGVWAVASAAALREGPHREAAEALLLGALLTGLVPALRYADARVARRKNLR